MVARLFESPWFLTLVARLQMLTLHDKAANGRAEWYASTQLVAGHDLGTEYKNSMLQKDQTPLRTVTLMPTLSLLEFIYSSMGVSGAHSVQELIRSFC